MHLQTHILSGWCVGNLFAANPRQRLFCMLAATLPDIDGLGIVFGWEAYLRYHHQLHNLLFCVTVAAVLAAFSKQRARSFVLYLALTHLHLAMDYLGSGPLWQLPYLWPFSDWKLTTPETAWQFYSWQNLSAAGALMVWTIGIVYRCGRTPLEAIMPSLDRQLVVLARRWPRS